MNYKRAISFAVILYIFSMLLGFISLGLGWATPTEYSLQAFTLTWVVYIPAILFLAKWFFKRVAPTTQRGFQLGLITIFVSVCLDLFFIAATAAAGQPIGAFAEMYASWEFYATIGLVLVLTTFAGYEFDKTYTSLDNPPEV